MEAGSRFGAIAFVELSRGGHDEEANTVERISPVSFSAFRANRGEKVGRFERGDDRVPPALDRAQIPSEERVSSHLREGGRSGFPEFLFPFANVSKEAVWHFCEGRMSVWSVIRKRLQGRKSGGPDSVDRESPSASPAISEDPGMVKGRSGSLSNLASPVSRGRDAVKVYFVHSSFTRRSSRRGRQMGIRAGGGKFLKKGTVAVEVEHVEVGSPIRNRQSPFLRIPDRAIRRFRTAGRICVGLRVSGEPEFCSWRIRYVAIRMISPVPCLVSDSLSRGSIRRLLARGSSCRSEAFGTSDRLEHVDTVTAVGPTEDSARAKDRDSPAPRSSSCGNSEMRPCLIGAFAELFVKEGSESGALPEEEQINSFSVSPALHVAMNSGRVLI
ncbi:hypothetical protein R1flu_007986 [Riccia fluitans]|uniref:Uncharacterized protein n=1 Tax=Riccia fluitans TaxID=41844 RepID=A0ABD1YAH3_9MARC